MEEVIRKSISAAWKMMETSVSYLKAMALSTLKKDSGQTFLDEQAISDDKSL